MTGRGDFVALHSIHIFIFTKIRPIKVKREYYLNNFRSFKKRVSGYTGNRMSLQQKLPTDRSVY